MLLSDDVEDASTSPSILLVVDCCRSIHPLQYPHALPNLATSRFWNRESISARSKAVELVLTAGIPLDVVVGDDEARDTEDAIKVGLA